MHLFYPQKIYYTADALNETGEAILRRFPEAKTELILQHNRLPEMDEGQRVAKFNKFGGRKYVYSPEMMREMKEFIGDHISDYFSEAALLYWT